MSLIINFALFLQFLPPWENHFSMEARYRENLLLVSSPCWSASAAKSHQSCLTLCDPIDGSPPGSAVPGILQARTLEWVAIFFSNAWNWKVKVKLLSCVWFLMAPWPVAYQAPPSMGFSRQEYWSGLPFPSPFDFWVVLIIGWHSAWTSRTIFLIYLQPQTWAMMNKKFSEAHILLFTDSITF